MRISCRQLILQPILLSREVKSTKICSQRSGTGCVTEIDSWLLEVESKNGLLPLIINVVISLILA